MQLLPEVADALKGLFLLGRVQLLLGEGVVLVYGARKGCERGGEGAEGSGRRVSDVSEVATDVGALLERRVEGCVLAGGGKRTLVRLRCLVRFVGLANEVTYHNFVVALLERVRL